MKKNIGIIGYGNMGSIIGKRLKSKYQVWAFDKDRNKTKNLLDINIAETAIDLVSKVDIVILAVKPQDFAALLKQIKKYISQKLVISIAAGISTGYIENKLGKIRVIRVMPNLPAKVGKGMICLCKGQYSLRADLDLTLELFVYLGKTMLIKENLMNTATAISGSGPGYFYHLIQDKPKKDWEVYAQEQFIPALSASAQRIGFNSDQAQLLAQTTAVGSIALLEESGIPPGILCAQVASKGGTTEAGLKVLQRNIDYLEDSVTAALKRAGELSKKTD